MNTGQHGDDVTFGANSGGTWDQFAANEEKFGITTRFDENVYTTKLDRSGKDFKERERKAERIAAEITGVGGDAALIIFVYEMCDSCFAGAFCFSVWGL